LVRKSAKKIQTTRGPSVYLSRVDHAQEGGDKLEGGIRTLSILSNKANYVGDKMGEGAKGERTYLAVQKTYVKREHLLIPQ